MQKALTDKTIEAIKAGPKRQEVHDLRCPGMTLRVERSGRKTFYVKFRYGLKQKRMKLGVYLRRLSSHTATP
ncbi:DUF4102 domain-containing protein [Sphingomonas koreensis]|nr:DUF4102 domain-containing protein [Sphingomonas koreensis]